MDIKVLSIFIVCLILATLLSRFRISIVKPKEQKKEDEDGIYKLKDNYVRVKGDMNFIRRNSERYVSDAEIINKATEKFREIFIVGLRIQNLGPEMLDEYFEIRVYKSLSDNNQLISEAVAKNKDAQKILEIFMESVK